MPPDQPFKTFQELLAYSRKNPGKLNDGYSHAGSGQMAMELHEKQTPGRPKCFSSPSGGRAPQGGGLGGALKQVGGVDGKPLYIVGIP